MIIKNNNRELTLLKSHQTPDYTCKTILSDSVFDYVELWLRNHSRNNDSYKSALFYWRQSKHFYNASLPLPIEARPLTAYYACLNATKSLLAIHGISLTNIGHGITASRNTTIGNIRSDKVTFSGGGVLYELSRILHESLVKQSYTIYDLLYNLPCIHRTFTITTSATELFIPICKCRYVMCNSTNFHSHLYFQIDKRYTHFNMLRNISPIFERTTLSDRQAEDVYFRVKKHFDWNTHISINNRIAELTSYHCKIRKYFHYITSQQMLWYIKKELPRNSHIVDRSSMTIIYAVMHWLSELVRYKPDVFDKLMQSKYNWVLQEFMIKSLPQFIDEISSEITGANIMCTGIRK